MSVFQAFVSIWVMLGVLSAITWWVLHFKDATCGGDRCICFRVTLTFFLVAFWPTFFLAHEICKDG